VSVCELVSWGELLIMTKVLTLFFRISDLILFFQHALLTAQFITCYAQSPYYNYTTRISDRLKFCNTHFPWQSTHYLHTHRVVRLNELRRLVRGSLVGIILYYITSKCLLRYATEVTQNCIARGPSWDADRSLIQLCNKFPTFYAFIIAQTHKVIRRSLISQDTVGETDHVS
jgi:hypothetical protein